MNHENIVSFIEIGPSFSHASEIDTAARPPITEYPNPAFTAAGLIRFERRPIFYGQEQDCQL